MELNGDGNYLDFGDFGYDTDANYKIIEGELKRVNNKTFDLFQVLAGGMKNVVDVTTMDSKLTLNSSIINKLRNLSELDSKLFANRTLQIYLPEGKYTADEINKFGESITKHLELNKIKNVDFFVSEIGN